MGQSRVFRQLHVVNRDQAIHAQARQHEENSIMSTGCGALPESVQNCNMEVISQMAARTMFRPVSRRNGAAPWRPSATTVTARRASSRSPTDCSGPQTAVRWRWRSLPATPGTPPTVASQVDRVRSRFDIDHVALVGDHCYSGRRFVQFTFRRQRASVGSILRRQGLAITLRREQDCFVDHAMKSSVVLFSPTSKSRLVSRIAFTFVLQPHASA